MTTTSILDRAGYEQMTREAREVRTGYGVLFVIAKCLFMVGFVFGRIVPCIVWCVKAVQKGYHAAYGPSKNMKIEALSAQVQRLEAELSRFTSITLEG